MLAMPCATSSMLARCRPPIMPSATTAESSDSIAPRAAMAKAGPTSCPDGRPARRAAARVGEATRCDLAEAAADRLHRQIRERAPAAVAAISATKGAGIRRLTRGQSDEDQQRDRTEHADRGGIDGVGMSRAYDLEPLDELRGRPVEPEARAHPAAAATAMMTRDRRR